MWFTSDNAAGAAPGVIEAMTRASEGPAMAYGDDAQTDRASDMIRELFEAPAAAVRFVATGTAANALALATLTPPWTAIWCHDHAHIEEDECGAPEFYTGGAKLVKVGGAHGRMDRDALRAALGVAEGASIHNVQKGALSLTQATEAGTVYSAADLAALAGAAKAAGVPVHLDGTRFANAIAATGASPAEMSWKIGVDILCLGFTKNGAPAAEAVVMFDESRVREFDLRRKRGGHLFSKMRFITAQVEAMLEGGAWLRFAAHANAMAARLAEGLAGLPGVRILHPVEANLVFVELPRAAHEAALAKGAAYHNWPAEGRPDHVGARLVASYATREEDVDRLIAALKAG
ncbi:threonine aldolase family protein [Pikeienuella sp. HZG-20]|uniref:threonine aldolase family protein n=1 Tax=Paludibacillus litoralis TaxID=3133267 RepID=UPI0030EBA52D